MWSFIDPIRRFSASIRREDREELRAGTDRECARMTIDRDGNVWVTDAQIKDGKGNQVLKFSPTGNS